MDKQRKIFIFGVLLVLLAGASFFSINAGYVADKALESTLNKVFIFTGIIEGFAGIALIIKAKKNKK